jgi:hypothetical protein
MFSLKHKTAYSSTNDLSSKILFLILYLCCTIKTLVREPSTLYLVEARPECRTDPECAQNQACLNERCIDPCLVKNPCAPQAQCNTRAHHPVCTCPEGYGGDPYRQCYRPECRTDTDCPLDKACVQENCVNPCLSTSAPCGRGAECRVDFHAARCVCPVGLQGNPLVACVSVECQVDDDCRDDQACDFLSQTCGPVCKPTTCAEGAVCSARRHQPECACSPGARGNGFVACIRRKDIFLSFMRRERALLSVIVNLNLNYTSISGLS